MKRCLLFVLLNIYAIFYAQNMRYGATINLHKGSIWGIHDFSKGRVSTGFGVFAQIPLASKEDNKNWEDVRFFLQPQIEYSFEGEKASPPQGEQKFLNNYIALPIYLKYHFSFNKNPQFPKSYFIMAGPRFAYCVSEKREGAPVYTMFIIQEKKFNNFNFGVSLGAGYRINKDFEAFFRWDRGFSKVYPDYTQYRTFTKLTAVGINYLF